MWVFNSAFTAYKLQVINLPVGGLCICFVSFDRVQNNKHANGGGVIYLFTFSVI